MLYFPMLHPVTLLISWFAFALALQWMPVAWLITFSLLCLVTAAVVAAERTFNLLRRSRWLFLSLAVLYFLATPGEYVAGFIGDMGISYEGLHLATEQIARLLAMLTSLALLHQVVGTSGLLGGFHWLLSPFPWREATVVRLMLVLEYVEQRRPVRWQGWLMPDGQGEGPKAETLTLSLPGFQWRDRVILMVVCGILLMVIRS